jgi:hypothetical protein
MMFSTEVTIPEFARKIDYAKGTVFIGSCFSDNIGQKLVDLKFPTDVNPFGVLYNPVSIANSLTHLIAKRCFDESDLFRDQGIWNSFSHHSSFSDVDPGKALNKINERIEYSHRFLNGAEFLMITFGTAWAYQLEGTEQIVSNCHKVPASRFRRIKLGVDEIVENYRLLLEKLWTFNPKLKVVFTVSPIRHWKDGAVENQVSKATLILAINELRQTFASEACSYFPAYELVMDELRDYRFYAADMLHLSDVAVNYIFERFQSVLISKEARQVAARISKVRKAMNHRPFNTGHEEYIRFVEANIQEINKLSFSFPNINFIEELAFFESKLA